MAVLEEDLVAVHPSGIYDPTWAARATITEAVTDWLWPPSRTNTDELLSPEEISEQARIWLFEEGISFQEACGMVGWDHQSLLDRFSTWATAPATRPWGSLSVRQVANAVVQAAGGSLSHGWPADPSHRTAGMVIGSALVDWLGACRRLRIGPIQESERGDAAYRWLYGHGISFDDACHAAGLDPTMLRWRLAQFRDHPHHPWRGSVRIEEITNALRF